MLFHNDNLKRDHLTGFYRGIVKKHLPHGKCKIYIPGVYESEYENSTDYLPDAEQASGIFAGTNLGNGVFSYPNINSIVWCFFENEDANYPVYFATTLGGVKAREHYDYILPLSSEPSKCHTIHCHQTWLDIFEDGKVNLYVVKEPVNLSSDYRNMSSLSVGFDGPNQTLYINSQKEVNAYVKDVINLTCDNEVNAYVKNTINLTCDNTVNGTVGSVTNIKCPTTNITGDVNITGNVKITGNETITGHETVQGGSTIDPDAVIGGKSFLGHTHMGDGGPAPAPTSPPL